MKRNQREDLEDCIASVVEFTRLIDQMPDDADMPREVVGALKMAAEICARRCRIMGAILDEMTEERKLTTSEVAMAEYLTRITRGSEA